ncbi:2952_t:CDS:2, partial [Racocetra fulgida]
MTAAKKRYRRVMSKNGPVEEAKNNVEEEIEKIGESESNSEQTILQGGWLRWSQLLEVANRLLKPLARFHKNVLDLKNTIHEMENELNENNLDIMALNFQNSYLIEENKKLSKMDEDNLGQIKNLLIQVNYLAGVIRSQSEKTILNRKKRRL